MNTSDKPLVKFLYSQFNPAIRLMNRLRFPQKFTLISLLFALPLALLMILLVLNLGARIDVSNQERDGIAYLRALQAFSEQMIQGLLLEEELAGSPSAEQDVLITRRKMDDAFNTSGRA